ncbi:MAG: SUMF1/EgtB/PvdO family nonheme iron enzyme [Anaerolineae bacterium]|nr:SUMF1/EgtB/PvdO family nonheme iron enzyme [Anaerolineae bacterium]
MTDTGKKLESLRRQLKAARKNLLLIQEREAEYVMKTDIPLQLVKDERELEQQIADLETKIKELEPAIATSQATGASPAISIHIPPTAEVVSVISILFLVADPTDASRLRLGQELREIQEKLQLAKWRDKFKLEQRMSVRPVDISQALLDTQPQIVHFSGHGAPTGALYVEDQVGKKHPIQPEALAALFEQFTGQVSCVVLNACYSETQASAIAEHIEYVIGMNEAIGDKAAIAFSIGFYQALGAGCTIERAYKLGCAQIGLQNIPEHLTPVLIRKGQTPPPKSALIPVTIPIPAGPFWMGSASDDTEAHDNEKPRRKLDLPEYQIGRYPVTNVQYACFISNTGHNPPRHWDGGHVPASLADHPVVNVSFEDAEGYCRWLSEMAGQRYRLPTEEEWEKAARGGLPETRRYPWGDKWQPDSCNTREMGRNGTTPVREFEHVNRSPFEVIDLVGNVWEWTASWYERYPDSSHESVHYGRVYRVVRGGSWRSDCRDVHISCRGRYKPDDRRLYVGFRVALVATVL